MSTLFMISTVTPNSSRISLADYSGGISRAAFASAVMANDTAVIASTLDSNGSPLSVFRAPLPNGIVSGPPPVWFAGSIENGVADATYFYGVTRGSASVPADAMIRCPMDTTCSMPTILFRGHEAASFFAQDATAFYWTVANFATGQGFSVWKAAK